MTNSPRILLWDIETTPNIGYTWGKWDQNVIEFVQEWHLLTISWKWLGEKAVYVRGLDDLGGYQPGQDQGLALLARDLFDEADIVVAHNGVDFDTKKARARMIFWGLDPPSPVREVDTLKVARSQFAFVSNSLEELCAHLDLGAKGKPGWQTWLACMQNDPVAWRKMKEYCRNDVKLLEKLYLRLLPYMPTHPNVALMADAMDACPKCGVKGKMTLQGWRYHAVTKRRRYQCQACGGWAQGRVVERGKNQYQ